MVETILVFLWYNLNIKIKEKLYKRGGFMDRPKHLPEELSKEHIKWLRLYGICLNTDDENYNKVKATLKKWYPYEYYFYVDMELLKEARKKFDSLTVDDFSSPKEYWKSEKRITRNEKKRLIKELYGLEKKGIR